MHARGEVSDEEWALLEPYLRFAQRADGRGRPPADTRAVLNGVLWILRTGAQWRECPKRSPPYQTVHGRFQQWVRSGQLEKALGALAERLHERGLLDLKEGLIDGSFASAKKGASPSEKPSGARGPRSWPSPLLPVFLWPSPWTRPRRTNPNSSMRRSPAASSTDSRNGSSATRRMTPTRSTAISRKNTESKSLHPTARTEARVRTVGHSAATNGAGP